MKGNSPASWGLCALSIAVFSLRPCLAADEPAAQAVKPVAITTTSLPPGVAGVAYRAVLAARDGKPPYKWSRAAGSLPSGLNLGVGGVIAGTPKAQGNYTFTVRVSDSSRPVLTARKALSIKVGPPAVKPVVITTASLPPGVAGVAYSAALAARDGKPPYKWSRVGGSLPSGLNLGVGGVIAGTPKAQGNYTFTVQVSDSSRPVLTARKALSIKVAPPQVTTVKITYKSVVWTARLASGKLEVQGAGQGSWGRKWSPVASNVAVFQQGIGTDQGPVLIYSSANRWHITQLNWASGAPQNRRSFTQPIVVTKTGQYGVTLKAGQKCYDYSWNALKEIDCKTGQLIRVIR